MTSGLSIEILDLRHFAASVLRPMLEVECALWRERLHWDYRASMRLLTQYLDGRMLPGFAAVEEGQVIGYAFCVYEDTKAVIGDVFTLPAYLLAKAPEEQADATLDFVAAQAVEPAASAPSPKVIEETLLTHLFEMLLNSPHVDRVESQLLLQPSGFQAQIFREAGFQTFRRLYMVQSLDGLWSSPKVDLPDDLELRSWRDEDLNAAGRLIAEAYAGHADSMINDQYRSIHGSLRFLNNIVRFSGCGVFAPLASHVIVERASRELAGLVLGSRISPESGHITQLCIHPHYRGQGFARALLAVIAHRFMRQGVREISLTVTESNTQAIGLYKSEGYICAHTFDASVWQRYGSASGMRPAIA